MKNIVKLIEAAFIAKRKGPKPAKDAQQIAQQSEEFRDARHAALQAINAAFEVGAKVVLRVDPESAVFPGCNIQIEKKADTAEACSYVLIPNSPLVVEEGFRVEEVK